MCLLVTMLQTCILTFTYCIYISIIETTNIPEVKDIPDFRRKLRDCRKNLSAADPLVRRLVNDGYICIYVNPDLEQYTKYAAQNVTKEKESQEPKMAAAAAPVYGTCV